MICCIWRRASAFWSVRRSSATARSAMRMALRALFFWSSIRSLAHLHEVVKRKASKGGGGRGAAAAAAAAAASAALSTRGLRSKRPIMGGRGAREAAGTERKSKRVRVGHGGTARPAVGRRGRQDARVAVDTLGRHGRPRARRGPVRHRRQRNNNSRVPHARPWGGPRRHSHAAAGSNARGGRGRPAVRSGRYRGAATVAQQCTVAERGGAEWGEASATGG
ncbi:hypothetical protein BU14_2860s0001 [Porphyra umbilicalis]|uniref:Uncharacterized protein n=1 Tax=Porphyra umbilicalis TaxID=2786 RepID=A0A1X6NJ80_PORUM|nr:hypothetical protein BU14_2860s0001 [Porphyra umbilicalis]|eukprot:OSX68403.1 hypothetical protein BU14_2860s0001 [Porphyra umbilicalis]